jgi:hypothetical protein
MKLKIYTLIDEHKFTIYILLSFNAITKKITWAF